MIKFFLLIGTFIFLLFGGTQENFKFRVGILTEDYGIVTDDDIAENRTIAHPVYTENPYKPNLVWQCLPLDNASLTCENISYDAEKSLYTCYPTLRIVYENHHYEFNVRRIYDLEDYKYLEHDIQEILQNEEVGCIAAYYYNEAKLDSNSPYKQHSLWTLDRIKSRKGIWSYFTN